MSKLQVVGSHTCKDTLYAMNVLTSKGVDFDFVDISSNLTDLKVYLRASPPLFWPTAPSPWIWRRLWPEASPRKGGPKGRLFLCLSLPGTKQHPFPS